MRYDGHWNHGVKRKFDCVFDSKRLTPIVTDNKGLSGDFAASVVWELVSGAVS
jgi:hypothetical protein